MLRNRGLFGRSAPPNWRNPEGKGWDALVSQDLKKAAMERVFGLRSSCSFVVSHLQLGLLLQLLEAPLSHESSERVAVYLTNSLTGWVPPKGQSNI